METLVVIDDEYRNQYYGKNGVKGSPHSRNFRDISCRTFQSGVGIFPTSGSDCTRMTKRQKKLEENTCPEEKLLSTHSCLCLHSETKKKSFFCDEFACSELWAGPAYSNSPPPSSLPIPKVFVPPKRTVSLDLPSSTVSGMSLHPIARSAPPSPKRESNSSARNLFLRADFASATKELSHILNLDLTDD